MRRAARLLLLCLLLLSSVVLLSGSAAAHPPFPVVFYGEAYSYGQPIAINEIITAEYNGTLCESHTITTQGRFGMIICPGDDNYTAEKDGAYDNETITFRYLGEEMVALGSSHNVTVEVAGVNITNEVYTVADPTYTEKAFKLLTLSHPIPFCGDGFCDLNFENYYNCFVDCFNTTSNETDNATTNNTGEGGGAETPPSGGGGGGGLPPGFLETLLGELPPGLETFLDSLQPCQENWECSQWSECPPIGVRNRTCTDLNECGTEDEKPAEIEACEYIPTCFDGIQNGGETGVDCGGPCKPCVSCSNGVQDCHVLPNGTRLCEEGVDCGGPCHPCDSCENGIQDWTETGIDCGGFYCPPCTAPPVIQIPLPVCRKDINPFRNDLIFFLLFMLLIIGGRVWYGVHQLEEAKKRKDLDEIERVKLKYRIKRSIYLFVAILLALTLIIYFYYYYFVLCEAEPKYLWWLVVLLVGIPIAIHFIIRKFEYNERAKLRKLERTLSRHRQHLIKLVEIENNILAQLEQELAEEIHQAMRHPVLRELFNDFPDLAAAYRNMMTLYERYRERKNPFEVERELCEEVYRLETDDNFLALAERHPPVKVIYGKLRTLYGHYETKQQLYDQIDTVDQRIDEDVESAGKKDGEKSDKKVSAGKERGEEGEKPEDSETTEPSGGADPGTEGNAAASEAERTGSSTENSADRPDLPHPSAEPTENVEN